MGYKCSHCGVQEVAKPGDLCELCQLGNDPYASMLNGSSGQNYAPEVSATAMRTPTAQQNDYQPGYVPKHNSKRKVLTGGSGQLPVTDPYGNDISEGSTQNSVQVYKPGQVQTVTDDTAYTTDQTNEPAQSSSLMSNGIVKNVSVEEEKNAPIVKWFRSLFKGIPFPFDNKVTLFQVFPDYSSTALNAQGNACDQVVVYGTLNSGTISENNDVEVYGYRDSHNNIIAKTIKNKASGTLIRPTRVIPVSVIWVLTVLLVAAAVTAVLMLGVEGLIWAAVIILCVTNLPLVIKIIGAILGVLFSILKRLFR